MRSRKGAVALAAAAAVVLVAFGFFVLRSGSDDVAAPPATTDEVHSSLVTREVEPGVFRVVHDGVRDMTAYLTVAMPTESPGIVAGDDASLWVVGSEIFPLGGEVVEFPPGTEGLDHVTSDGTLWVDAWSNDGEGWKEQPREPEWDAPASVHEWQAALEREDVTQVAVGPDGTLWLHQWTEWPDYRLRAFDGSEWREWRADELGAEGYWWVYADVAPDGSLWAIEHQGWMPDPEDVDPDTEPWCLGVMRFDGEQISRFAEGTCADSFDVGPDGAVWLLARTESDQDSTWDLYLIAAQSETAIE